MIAQPYFENTFKLTALIFEILFFHHFGGGGGAILIHAQMGMFEQLGPLVESGKSNPRYKVRVVTISRAA